MRDIACAQYVAGGNCKFFATGQASGGVASIDTCKNNMMKRLAFADDVGAPYDSMLAFPARAGQFTNGALDTVMCAAATVKPRPAAARSRVLRPVPQVDYVATAPLGSSVDLEAQHAQLLPGRRAGLRGVLADAAAAHHPLWRGHEERREHGVYRISEAARTRPTPEAARSRSKPTATHPPETRRPQSQGSTNNALCFTGPHRRYDPFAKGFFSLEPGQGHFGPDAIPGDARWRRGESVSLKTARDSMIGLELAAQAQMVYQTRP